METYKAPKRAREESVSEAQSEKNRNKIHQKIKTLWKRKEGLDSDFLVNFFSSYQGFLGVFPENFVSLIPIKRNSFFIINTVKDKVKNGHWIGIRIFSNHAEIYDSLGPLSLKLYPHMNNFLLFLKKLLKHFKVFVSPQLQHASSPSCGFYCLFFLTARTSFDVNLSYFTANKSLNDEVLRNKLF